jgi:nucleotide-binding universal stress UspA family protein
MAGPPPVLLCYDGSDSAKRAIEHAGALMAGGPAIVLTVWESLGSAVVRHGVPLPGEMGRDIRGLADDVLETIDSGIAQDAEAIAAEGAEIAAAAGFDARPEARRAIARTAERDLVTIWRAVLDAADESDASAIVLGSRGRSSVRSALLGSVSYGVVHHSTRPLLVVPPAD